MDPSAECSLRRSASIIWCRSMIRLSSKLPSESSPAGLRRLLHVTNALLTVALIGTGLLITYPDLRGQLIGGYGLQLANWHRTAAIAFLVAPVLALALAPFSLARELPQRLRVSQSNVWRRAHLLSFLVTFVALAVSGGLLWFEVELSSAVADVARGVHDTATWIVIVALPVHLYAARRKIAYRTASLLGRDKALGADPIAAATLPEMRMPRSAASAGGRSRQISMRQPAAASSIPDKQALAAVPRPGLSED